MFLTRKWQDKSVELVFYLTVLLLVHAIAIMLLGEADFSLPSIFMYVALHFY